MARRPTKAERIYREIAEAEGIRDIRVEAGGKHMQLYGLVEAVAIRFTVCVSKIKDPRFQQRARGIVRSAVRRAKAQAHEMRA